MAGSEISSLILTIAAITLATIITVSMFAVSIGISNSIDRTSEKTSNSLLTELTIIHVGYDNSSSTQFNIFIINTGEISISVTNLVLLYDNNFIFYNNNNESQYWILSYNASTSQSNNLNPNQLFEITVFTSASIGLESHSVVLSAGSYSTSYTFS